jgi:hypothetical protein
MAGFVLKMSPRKNGIFPLVFAVIKKQAIRQKNLKATL